MILEKIEEQINKMNDEGNELVELRVNPLLFELLIKRNSRGICLDQRIGIHGVNQAYPKIIGINVYESEKIPKDEIQFITKDIRFREKGIKNEIDKHKIELIKTIPETL